MKKKKVCPECGTLILATSQKCKKCYRYRFKHIKPPYERECPNYNCNNKIKYKYRENLLRAIRKNVLCRKCSRIGLDMYSEERRVEIKKKISQTLLTSEKYKEGMKKREKFQKRNDVRHNMRLGRIRYIEQLCGQITPNYNLTSIKIIEDYGKEHGYNFQHAENGGEFHIKELGYWVDGYDKEKNVVIEYYEKYHNKQANKERDKRRQQEIIEHLKCKFIIIKE